MEPVSLSVLALGADGVAVLSLPPFHLTDVAKQLVLLVCWHDYSGTTQLPIDRCDRPIDFVVAVLSATTKSTTYFVQYGSAWTNNRSAVIYTLYQKPIHVGCK